MEPELGAKRIDVLVRLADIKGACAAFGEGIFGGVCVEQARFRADDPVVPQLEVVAAGFAAWGLSRAYR
jgi:hypothetical protein